MWSIPVDLISLDAVEQVQEKLVAWQADAPSGGPSRHGYLEQVTFDSLQDPAERHYFKQVDTNLTLPAEQVERLRESPVFKRLLSDL